MSISFDMVGLVDYNSSSSEEDNQEIRTKKSQINQAIQINNKVTTKSKQTLKAKKSISSKKKDKKKKKKKKKKTKLPLLEDVLQVNDKSDSDSDVNLLKLDLKEKQLPLTSSPSKIYLKEESSKLESEEIGPLKPAILQETRPIQDYIDYNNEVYRVHPNQQALYYKPTMQQQSNQNNHDENKHISRKRQREFDIMMQNANDPSALLNNSTASNVISITGAQISADAKQFIDPDAPANSNNSLTSSQFGSISRVSAGARRTGQLTALSANAAALEMNLMAKRGKNNLTKKQTKAKYGW